jgi:hypothetical protein
MQKRALYYSLPDEPTYVSIHPRPLLPLEPPPDTPSPPPLPVPPRQSPFNDYDLTSHIIPAAYPRHACNPAPVIPRNESVDARKARVKRLTEELVIARQADQEGTPRGRVQDVAFYNVLTRYRLRDLPRGAKRQTGLTLLVLHANGFPKEVSWHLIFVSAAFHCFGRFGSLVYACYSTI